MALIKCPECGNDVSEKATMCPKCGCPIEVKTEVVEEQKALPSGATKVAKNKKMIMILLSIIGCGILILLCSMFFKNDDVTKPFGVDWDMSMEEALNHLQKNVDGEFEISTDHTIKGKVTELYSLRNVQNGISFRWRGDKLAEAYVHFYNVSEQDYKSVVAVLNQDLGKPEPLKDNMGYKWSSNDIDVLITRVDAGGTTFFISYYNLS